MSKVFYDSLLNLEKLEKRLAKAVGSREERFELERIIDEYLHHKVVKCILDELPEAHHEEFVVKLHAAPHDESILDYLTEKIEKDMREFLKVEIQSIAHEIILDLQEVSGKRKKKK